MNFAEWTSNSGLIIGIAVVILLAVVEVVVINRRRNASNDFSLQRRSRILSPSEKSFFECLLSALSDDFYIFTKVAALDVVEASPSAGFWETRKMKKRLIGECLDYVLCKKHDLSIFGIVELENFEKREDQKSKVAREGLISAVCKSAHLRLFYFDIRQDYHGVDIRRLVTGKSARKRNQASPQQTSETMASHLTVDNSAYESYAKSRSCPQCNGELVTKVAVKGKHIGEKYLLCRKYPYCDYRTHVNDANILKVQEQQAAATPKPAYKDWSTG